MQAQARAVPNVQSFRLPDRQAIKRTQVPSAGASREKIFDAEREAMPLCCSV